MTTFEKRVEDYIRANYDIPKEMTFWYGYREYDFEDWVEKYVADANENVDYPYDDDASDADVRELAESLLQIMTGHLFNGHMTGVFTVSMPAQIDKNDSKTRDMCEALYRGGWRKEDRWLLIDNYEEITPENASIICEILAEIEENEKED